MALISISPSSMEKLRSQAQAAGVVPKIPHSYEVDWSNGCESPVYHEFYSQEDPLLWIRKRHPKKKFWRFQGAASHLNKYFKDTYKAPPRLHFRAYLPCRKCPVCLRRRAWSWSQRAVAELQLSSRTWFCTFTVNPHERFLIDLQIGQDTAFRDADAFKARYAMLSREFTLYMKRIRKNSGAKLRYIMVAEAHQDGWPHLHALVHERAVPITKRTLQEAWKKGFSSAVLVPLSDNKVAFYVTKYIAKQALARIRASLRYGENDLFHSAACISDPYSRESGAFSRVVDCSSHECYE